MWKPLFAALVMALIAACETTPSAPISLTVRSDDGVLPSVSDAAGWAQHTPWDELAGTALGSGTNYIALATGDPTAASPGATSEVAVHYQVRLASDGALIDNSFGEGQAPILSLRNVLPGWRDALTNMHPGDRWLIYIPASRAYGRNGTTNVPPNADLIFEVKLLGITG